MGILDKKVVLITGTGGGLGPSRHRPLREKAQSKGRCETINHLTRIQDYVIQQ